MQVHVQGQGEGQGEGEGKRGGETHGRGEGDEAREILRVPLHTARAIYDFLGEGQDELQFIAGDIIEVARRDESGWWQGTRVGGDGVEGLFPGDYVEDIIAANIVAQENGSTAGLIDTAAAATFTATALEAIV